MAASASAIVFCASTPSACGTLACPVDFVNPNDLNHKERAVPKGPHHVTPQRGPNVFRLLRKRTTVELPYSCGQGRLGPEGTESVTPAGSVS